MDAENSERSGRNTCQLNQYYVHSADRYMEMAMKKVFHGLCKEQIYIHRKFIALNQGHEIDNCKIHEHEKRFMGFS